MHLLIEVLQKSLMLLFLLIPGPAVANEYPAPYRPYSDDLSKSSPIEFKDWDEAEFAKLDLDDPRLKRAYSEMFGTALNPNLYFEQSYLNAIVADIRRRGDAATPMLIKLMHENHETGFECDVLIHIAEVGTIDVGPYLEYAREVLGSRTQTMSAALAGSAATLIATHGKREDGELLKMVMQSRPFVADSVTRKLDTLNRRLGSPKQDPRPPLRSAYTNETDGNGASVMPQRPGNQITGTKPPGPLSWYYWVLLIAAAGVFAALLKNRK